MRSITSPKGRFVSVRRETKFQQDFQVGTGRKFNEDEFILFQALYRRFTRDFSPTSAGEAESEITTTCTIEKQTLGSRSRGTRTLTVEYTMAYESKKHNVAHYPRRFQNWMTNNSKVVRDRMQVLGINVTQLNSPVSRQVGKVVLDQMQVVGRNGTPLNIPVSPSKIAKVLTIGASIDRRKRRANPDEGDDKTNSTKKVMHMRCHNIRITPQRSIPISGTSR